MFIKQHHLCKAIFALIITALLPLSTLNAAIESVVVEVEFVAPITITEVNPLQFGLLSTAMVATNTVVIATDGTVTDASSLVLNATQAAADLTVTSTAASAITIIIDTIVPGTGYTLGTFLCAYGVAAAATCDGTGLAVASSAASETVLVGATLTGNGSDLAGAANGSFVMTVNYQ